MGPSFPPSPPRARRDNWVSKAEVPVAMGRATFVHQQGRFVPPGITNYDEYSLVREILEEKKEEQTGTLRKDKTLLRDEKKMERLKQKLHTDDERT